jgi:prevent-host-death family protein
MTLTNIHEAKTQVSKLLDHVDAGEEVIIARAGKPVARLVKYEEPAGEWRGGQWKGLVRIHNDFDAPLPDEVTEAFRGEQP